MPTEDEILLRAKARVGTTINARWLVDRVVGVGGMAVVYAATHCRNNKRAALKLLHPELSLDPESAPGSCAKATPQTRSTTRASSGSMTTA